MKIKITGNTFQEGIPTPAEPKEIINKVYVEVNGEKKELDIDLGELLLHEGDYLFRDEKDKKWYLKRWKYD